MWTGLAGIAMGIALLASAGCASTPKQVSMATPKPETTTVDERTLASEPAIFLFETTPPSYYDDAAKRAEGSMCLSVFLYSSNPLVGASRVKEWKVSDELGRHWTSERGNASDFIGGWNRFVTATYSNNDSVLGLRRYVLDVVAIDGTDYRRSFDPGAILASGGQPNHFIYSAFYHGNKEKDYLEGLESAVISKAEMSDNDATIVFTCHDTRAVNGIMTFYDKNKKFVGESSPFFNAYSQEREPRLNNNEALVKDGSPNTFRLAAESFFPVHGKSFADIDNVVVTLMDGPWPWDANTKDRVLLVSRSERTTLQKIN